MTYYEDEKLVARGGSIYGQLDGDNNVRIKFPKTSLPLLRSDITKPVSLKLLENGLVIHSVFFENSEIYTQDSLLVFEQSSMGTWGLSGIGSCKLFSECARIFVPPGFKKFLSSNKSEVLATDITGGVWLEVYENIEFQKDSENYLIELNQADNCSNFPILIGENADYDTNPNVTYMGWPELIIPDDYPYKKSELKEFINGVSKENLNLGLVSGLIKYSLRTKEGKTIFLKRFGVLPKDISISMKPAINAKPAKLKVKSSIPLKTFITSGKIQAEQSLKEDSAWLLYNKSESISQLEFTIEIMSDSCRQQPLKMKLPYPQSGAQLVGPDNNCFTEDELIVEQLIGHRIIMASGENDEQNYFIELQLCSKDNEVLKRDFVYYVGQKPVVVNLYSYKNNIMNMLRSVDNQDAYVRLTVETGLQAKKLLSIDIRRFNGKIDLASQYHFKICSYNKDSVFNNINACAMQISNPQQKPIPIEEKTSEGVGTGLFSIEELSQKKGLWLIIPDKTSQVVFRPRLFDNNSREIKDLFLRKNSSDSFNPITLPDKYTNPDEAVKSLHHATNLFHPVHNSEVINEQISKMEADFQHSGWQYFIDLMTNYEHLPLSTFESWKALAVNKRTLAFSLYRLDKFDELFCQRISEELAVIWEEIPIHCWVQAQKKYTKGLNIAGVPEDMVNHLVESRQIILENIIPGFNEFKNYINSGNISDLTTAPIEIVIPMWYQDLRRRHESDDSWPTKLNNELASWINRQDLPEFFKKLSMMKFTDSVTYLPIFMAFVTVGKAKLEDLNVPLVKLKYYIQIISDFDRNDWYSCVHAMIVSYLLKDDA